jgi:archaemetzincin
VQVWRPAPPAADVAAALAAITAAFDVEILRRDDAELPVAAYYAPRKRHRADKLLELLDAYASDGDRVIGLTDGDISTTKDEHDDWGVMGLGTIGGPSCVVSRFRCRKNVGAALARTRFAKVAIHELGHTFGSDHCAVRGCLMEDAGGKASTLERETDFCPATRALFTGRGVPLRSVRAFPWGSDPPPT